MWRQSSSMAVAPFLGITMEFNGESASSPLDVGAGRLPPTSLSPSSFSSTSSTGGSYWDQSTDSGSAGAY
ncbi:hypothetical protein ACHAXH_004705 [Discostella pseudostelligera]